MAELAGPLRVMKIAIQTAKIAYPDTNEREAPNGRISTLIRQRPGCSRLRPQELWMERVLTSSQRKISPMPTGPKGEKRPADVLGKRRFKPFH